MKNKIISVLKLTIFILIMKNIVWYITLYLYNLVAKEGVLLLGIVPIHVYEVLYVSWFYLVYSITLVYLIVKGNVLITKIFSIFGLFLIFFGFYGIDFFISNSQTAYFFAGIMSYAVVLIFIFKWWIPKGKATTIE